MKKVHRNYETEETGFWINSDYPQLGESPDLIVIDPDMPKDCVGLAEVICPKLLENVTFHDAPVKLNVFKREISAVHLKMANWH